VIALTEKSLGAEISGFVDDVNGNAEDDDEGCDEVTAPSSLASGFRGISEFEDVF